MPTITFNGKSYNSIEEMSANEQMAYEQLAKLLVDKNGNGIPDFLEGDVIKNISSIYTSAQSINYNGNVYNNLNELPPEVQAKVQSAFVKMGDMGLVAKDSAMLHAAKHQIENEPYLKSTPFVSREYNPAIEEDKGSSPLVWLLIAVGLMACLGIAAVIIFFLVK